MSYQDKCERLHKDKELLIKTIKTIHDMKIEIDSVSNCVRDVKTIKTLVKTVLSVVGSE